MVRRLLLPGVGAFKPAMRNLKASHLYDSIRDWLTAGRPLMGICLGLQLLFEESEEARRTRGLSFFKGKVVRFKEHKIPQIGWNQIEIRKAIKLTKGIKNGSFFYFLHSYYAQPADQKMVAAVTEYGLKYPSIVSRNNVYGVQFHPEKSGEVGLRLMRNWIKSC